ncbi:MAG: glycoside hydrolase family 127 protein [Bacteroidota bacterium]
MKNIWFKIFGIFLLTSCSEEPKSETNVIQFPQPVSYLDVEITDGFWKEKIDKNRMNGIRHALDQASTSIGYFDVAASGKKDQEHTGNLASDSDVYKIIQGAAYALHHSDDPELEASIDAIISRIAAAQQPDGYLFTYWTINDPSQRWKDLDKKHELYCAGHLFEAAAAYYQVTGKRELLDVAIRFADYIDTVFGPGKLEGVPGHEEIELGLFKLYEATGDRKYLDLSVYFVDERGNPKRIASKLEPPEHDPNAGTPWRWRPPSYMQDHLPVTQQFYAVGHAVRAGYLYSAMTALAMELNEEKYVPALDSIWWDVVNKKLYITGGIGTRQHHNEGFGTDFLLPNDQAYCETCSSIALTFWNRRMSQLHTDTKYADLAELTMYNSAISGVSLEGDRFFYSNPLASDGSHYRKEWFNPPCCPSNMVRFLPEIGATIYSKTNTEIYINQFIPSSVDISLNDHEVEIVQETDYPWDGLISFTVNPEKAIDFTLKIRVPGWAQGKLIPGQLYNYMNTNQRNVTVQVNGELIEEPEYENGFIKLTRSWKDGDQVQVQLPMKINYIVGDPRIESTQGKLVLSRGPFIYCLEQVDNTTFFSDSSAVVQEGFSAEFDPELLGGIVKLKGKAVLNSEELDVTAIPYYAWSNRGQGKMEVWLPYINQ